MLIESRIEITEKTYMELLGRSRNEVEKYVADVAIKTGWHPAGYDLLFPRLYSENGKYFVCWKHYDSCD